MRVALVSTSYPPATIGGAERSLRELAQGLVALSCEVAVVCLGAPATGVVVEYDGAVRVVRIGSSAFAPFLTGGKNSSTARKLRWHLGEFLRLGAYRSLRIELRRFRPDVVHTNNLAGFGWMGWLAAAGFPLVHTVRDYYLTCMSSNQWHSGHDCRADNVVCRVGRSPMRLTPQRPDLFVGVSADILKQHRMRGAVGPREASAVVYNRPALDISGARAERQDRPFTFGLLGRVGRDKGTFVALEAYRRLVQGEDRPLELLIGGEASDGDAAELRSRTPDEGKVRLLGAVDPADFYARVDCALVPTQWPEPFGRTAAEALLAGVPLLASAAGGLPEVVDAYGGRAALVAEFTDPASWADAMSKSMHGPLPAVPSGPPLPEPHSAYLNVYERVLHAHRGKKNGSARPFRRVPRRPSPSSDGRRQRVREQAPD